MDSEITFETERGAKRVKKVGPGFWGYIYKPEKEPYCYRLIPIEEVRSIEIREAIKQLKGKPRTRGVAPVKDVFQCDISGKTFLAVQYEIFRDDFWVDIIKQHDARVNLLFFIEILKILPLWWSQLGVGLIPLPSEIVFSENIPFILQMPLSDLPGIGTFLDESERAEYLAPEYFRISKGQRSSIGRNLDIYAIGVGIHKGLHREAEPVQGEDNIRKLFFGSLHESGQTRKKLPQWCEKVVEIRSIYNYVDQMMARDIKFRSYNEPEKLSPLLARNLIYFDSSAAVRIMLEKGNQEMAYSLIKEILLTEPAYDNLLLAAEIARDLKLTLESIEYLEEAINKFKTIGELKAYFWQLDLLIHQIPELIVESVIKKTPQFIQKIEFMIERDYRTIPFDAQEDYVDEVTSILLAKSEYDKAASLLYPHLYDSGKTFLWWKFDRTIAYARCLAGQRRKEDAGKFMAGIKEKLNKAESEGRLQPELLRKYRKSLLEVEKRLFEQDFQSNHS